MDHSHTLNIFNRINFLRVTREYKKKKKLFTNLIKAIKMEYFQNVQLSKFF